MVWGSRRLRPTIAKNLLPSLRGAKRRSNPVLTWDLDCSASLAMTEERNPVSLTDIAQREPLLVREDRRPRRGAVFLAHQLQPVLGERMVGEERQVLVLLVAGDPEHQLTHRLRRPAELAHDIN